MSRRIFVHHFVLSLTTRQYGGHPTSDLLGVDYWFTIPKEREFPVRVGRMDVFTRLYFENVRRATFRIEIWGLDSQSQPRNRIGVYGPFKIQFIEDQSVADRVFKLPNVRLAAPGVYVVRLLRRRRNWQGESWYPIRETHFCVVRP